MTDIYDQHSAAFSRVSAFVILRDGERVATVAFKFPADGAGRLYAYVHWIGDEMVRGFAGGYGYDKQSAAVAAAARKLCAETCEAENPATWREREDTLRVFAAFRSATVKDGGERWSRALEIEGFTVLQAV